MNQQKAEPDIPEDVEMDALLQAHESMLRGFLVEVYPQRDFEPCDHLVYAPTALIAVSLALPFIDPPIEDEERLKAHPLGEQVDLYVKPDATEPYIEWRRSVLRLAGFLCEGELPCDSCGLYALDMDEHWVCDECYLCRVCAHHEECGCSPNEVTNEST